MGIVFWEILCRKFPFENYNTPQLVVAVCERNERPPLPADCLLEFKRLIEYCWHPDPNQRPSCSEVVAVLEKLNKEFI